MKILALNTSFKNTYAVVINGDNVCSKQMDSKLKQSENVLQLIDELLTNQNLKIKDLDAIACVIGPGSFTGIRIGLSLTKGFLLPFKNIKFIPITSFELMLKEARENGIDGDITCVINALSGKFFVQSFSKNNDSLTEPRLIEGEDINNLVGITVGLSEEQVSFCNKYVDFNLSTLQNVATQKYDENIFAQVIEPLYIRKSQAEDEFDKKSAKND